MRALQAADAGVGGGGQTPEGRRGSWRRGCGRAWLAGTGRVFRWGGVCPPAHTHSAHDHHNEGLPRVVQEYGVKGFPTLKLFVDGKLVEDYQVRAQRTRNMLFHLLSVQAIVGTQ